MQHVARMLTCQADLLSEDTTMLTCLVLLQPLQPWMIHPSAGPLCRQHDILFLKNSRFAGLKFPDMANPMTLDVKFRNVLPSDALDFLK
jgi:hypothetical protein